MANSLTAKDIEARYALMRLANILNDLLGYLTSTVVPVTVAHQYVNRIERIMQELERGE